MNSHQLTYLERRQPLWVIETIELAHRATTAQSAGRVGTKK